MSALDQSTSPFTPARFFLPCRVIELALKAFLSRKQKSLVELAQSEFGHDLDRILDKAEQHGLSGVVELGKQQRDVIRRASAYYREKVFEYPALDEAIHSYPKLPDCTRLLDTAERLVAGLEPYCVQ